MISANGSLPAHRYTPQVTQRWPRGSEPASVEQDPAEVQKRMRTASTCLKELRVQRVAVDLKQGSVKP